MSGDLTLGRLPGAAYSLESSIRALLRREPDFAPTPAQLARYQRLKLPADLLAELRQRAGEDACQLAETWERQGV
jgi:hypothetical protein